MKLLGCRTPHWHCCDVSLAGDATSVIFVATNILCLSRQKYFVGTKVCLSRKHKTFVATNICCDKSFCHDKHTFVATKDVVCAFVATKMILVAAPASDSGGLQQATDCTVYAESSLQAHSGPPKRKENVVKEKGR